MSVLPNAKHERFAQAIAQGRNGRDSYRTAGYDVKTDASADAAASRLLSDVRIKGRIAELQARAADGVVITRQKILEELGSIALAPLGHDVVRPADKRAALVDIAKLEGWVIERSMVGKPGDFDLMTPDELRDYVAGEAEALGLRDEAAALSGRESGGRKQSRGVH